MFLSVRSKQKTMAYSKMLSEEKFNEETIYKGEARVEDKQKYYKIRKPSPLLSLEA